MSCDLGANYFLGVFVYSNYFGSLSIWNKKALIFNQF
jgi:hypothetical protein